MDPDSNPDPSVFVIDPQGANKKNFLKQIFLLVLLKVHLHHFQR